MSRRNSETNFPIDGVSIRSSDDTDGTVKTLNDEEKNQDIHPSNENFLVEWDGDNDPLNPRSLPTLKKWLIVFTISMGSLLVSVLSLFNIHYLTCNLTDILQNIRLLSLRHNLHSNNERIPLLRRSSNPRPLPLRHRPSHRTHGPKSPLRSKSLPFPEI